MKHLSARLAFASLAPVAFVLLAACSSNKVEPAGPRVCAPADCANGNTCINDGTETKCRLACVAHTDCPATYQCVNNPSGDGSAFCVKNTTVIASAPGQWGTGCLPTDGETPNQACDSANGFICYGTGPTDANAYCTHPGCTTDLDCTPGYWCGTVDNAPNVKASARTFGKTRPVCLKHDYCSPCGADRDCPVIDGKQSRCADDFAGGKYCATVCTATTECRLDAACNNPLADGTKVCAPRAGTCKGDGSLCSPCRSDADCTDGYCIKGNYTPERFCSVKAKSPCMPMVKGDCPTFTTVKGTQIGCQSVGDENIPKDQCIGIVEFGESGDVGCYTKHP